MLRNPTLIKSPRRARARGYNSLRLHRLLFNHLALLLNLLSRRPIPPPPLWLTLRDISVIDEVGHRHGTGGEDEVEEQAVLQISWIRVGTGVWGRTP